MDLGFINVGYLDAWRAKYGLTPQSYTEPNCGQVVGKETQGGMLKRIKTRNSFQAHPPPILKLRQVHWPSVSVVSTHPGWHIIKSVDRVLEVGIGGPTERE